MNNNIICGGEIVEKLLERREWLVDLRDTSDLTQVEVSQLIGIERSTYTKAEIGYPISVKTAKMIANYYGVDWTLFFK